MEWYDTLAFEIILGIIFLLVFITYIAWYIIDHFFPRSKLAKILEEAPYWIMDTMRFN